MARYINDLRTNAPVENVMNQIHGYLQNEGFSQKPDGSWQKGMGLLTGPQLVHVAPANGAIHIEAWIKFALLPGVYLGELGTTGAFGMIPKRALKKRVDVIESMVQQTA